MFHKRNLPRTTLASFAARNMQHNATCTPISQTSKLCPRHADHAGNDALYNKRALASRPCTPEKASKGSNELKIFVEARHDVTRCTTFAKDDQDKQGNDIGGNANDVYQALLRLKASLEVVPIREDPTTIALHLKRMSLANRSAFDDVSDLVRLKSAIALCTSSNSNRLNRSTCEMMKQEQALEAHHLNIRMGQRVPRRLKPEPKVTSQW